MKEAWSATATPSSLQLRARSKSKATFRLSDCTTAEHNDPLLERLPEATNHQCSLSALTAHSLPQNLLTLFTLFTIRATTRGDYQGSSPSCPKNLPVAPSGGKVAKRTITTA